jgi:DNA anti-recombination protein RmuC
VDHATSLITEMKIVNEQLEKVGKKIKEMQKDVDRGSKSMMYNLEQKIQIHLREKRNLYRGGGESKGLSSANELS